MPPLRTMPPAKVLKTERTHEENQERAYIAASRRSDRSLEARVESARRASEIHKRRTGRSLRVTEQDVVNEEMYEEEDDDLPMQYRRLTAHLQTGSADFNRRLSAYLTNHVAMRTALDQAVTHSYAQQYPNAPQFAHNQPQFPSPFPNSPSHSAHTRSPHTPYGQPYPMPGAGGYRPSLHARRASHSVVQGGRPSFGHQAPPTPNSIPEAMVDRQLSERRSAPRHTESASQSPAQQRRVMPQNSQMLEANDHIKTENLHDPSQQHSHTAQPDPRTMSQYSSMSPFSMTLPVESQMFLNGALDPNDPMTSAFMAGSADLPADQGYGAPQYMKPRSLTHPFTGMSTTLAPSALDMQPRQTNFHQQPNMSSMLPSDSADQNFAPTMPDGSKGTPFLSQQDSQGSGAGTPSLDAGLEAFINDSIWNDSNVT